MEPLIAAGVAVFLSIVAHLIAMRTGLRHVVAFGLSFLVGILAIVPLTRLVVPGTGTLIWPVISAIVLFATCWFVFLNVVQSTESSLRVNILREVLASVGRLERGKLYARYNDDALIHLRLARLIKGHTVEQRGNRLFVVSMPLLILARAFRIAKLIILGRRSEFY